MNRERARGSAGRPLGSPALRLPDPAAVGACAARVWRLWCYRGLTWTRAVSHGGGRGIAVPSPPSWVGGGRLGRGPGRGREPVPSPASRTKQPRAGASRPPPPRQGPPGRAFTPGEPAPWLLLKVRRRPPHFCPQNLPPPAQTAPPGLSLLPAASPDLRPPSSPLSPSTEEVPEVSPTAPVRSSGAPEAS